jgi:hypothetical protein
MMVCFADGDRALFERALQRDTACWIFEFDVYDISPIRYTLASSASCFGLGGFVRRIASNCVKCKVVSSLKNRENLAFFLEEIKLYPEEKLPLRNKIPELSSDQQDLIIASSKRFVVHSPVITLRNRDSPDSKDGIPWDNVSVVSSHSASESSVK